MDRLISIEKNSYGFWKMILDFFKRKRKSKSSSPPDSHSRINPNQLGGVGQYGEDKAAEYLFLHGYNIIERNIKYGKLEIDIIAENERFLVFAEVKTRTFYSDNNKFGPPSAAVNAKKKNNIKTAARAYIKEHGYNKKPRLDIVEIYLNKTPDGYSLRSINHIEGAFGGQIFPTDKIRPNQRRN